MQSQIESDFKVGSVYYKKLKDLYRPNSSPLSLLKAKDQKLAVGDRLMKAMVATKAPVPNRSPMVDYLNSCVVLPNRTEIVGISRCACELKPSITTTQLPVALDMCKFMAKRDLKKHFPDEIAIMLPWIDATLVQAYIQVKKSSLRLSSFIELHKNTLGLVLDMGLVNKLLEAKTSWIDVGCPELGRRIQQGRPQDVQLRLRILLGRGGRTAHRQHYLQAEGTLHSKPPHPHT